MHYRESVGKYNEVLKHNRNLTLIDDDLNELPLQLLFPKMKCVIGFHSSVITQFGNTFPGKAISLSGFVHSEHAQNFVRTQPNGVVFLDKYEL